MGFEEEKHPRDDNGRFIETAGEKLKVWGSSRGVAPRERDKPDERLMKVGDFMRAAKETLSKNPQGFTLRPGYKAPSSGTVVSLPTRFGLSLQVEAGQKLKRSELRAWVKKARHYLSGHDNTYIGGWRNDDGKVYFDVNEVYGDHETALRLGRERNQEAVFRLDDFTVHATGGSGA